MLKRLVLLLLCLAMMVSLAPVHSQTGKTVYVPDSFPTIQDAVNNAVPGTTIIVRDGVYRENIVVEEKRDLVIMSEHGPKKTIIYNSREESEVNVVELSVCKNIVFQGFTIANDKDYVAYGIKITSDIVTVKSNVINGPNINTAIILESCSAVTIENSTLKNLVYGIQMSRTTGVLVKDNIIVGMDFSGIYFRHNNGWVTVSGNIISSCNRDGITLGDAVHCEIFLNSITGCQESGIRVSSPGNSIYLNNFVDNGQHVAIQMANTTWNSQPLDYIYDGRRYRGCLGNFWDNYKGVDSNRDGVGDTPYTISEGQVDRYPLMELIRAYQIIPSSTTSTTTSPPSTTPTTSPSKTSTTTTTSYTSPSYTTTSTSSTTTSTSPPASFDMTLFLVPILVLVAVVLAVLVIRRGRRKV